MLAGTVCRIAVVGLVALGAGGGAVAAGHAAPGSAAPAASAEREHAVPDAGHAAGGHGAHDPYDLTHANAGPKLNDPAEWRYDMALCTFAVFVVLLALLWRLAWLPLMRGLDMRERFLANKHAEAERAAAQAQAELRAYQEQMAGAQQKAMQIVAQGRKDAEAVAERIQQEAQQAAARERSRAAADIQAAKNAALREVAYRGADLAVTLAGRIVRRELRSADHAALITEALEQLPSSN